ncbi:FecR domain-containing protein [Methyloradius palustris]|nr:FecR domain-containing protein [Methyloradius palustris]
MNTNYLLSSALFILITGVTPPLYAATDTHKVVKGDTLYQLSKQYLGNSNAWHAFLRVNTIKNPRQLVPGSTLVIPTIDTQLVTIVYVQGDVELLSSEGVAGKALQMEDVLAAGAQVRVGKNSYVSFQFKDGSIARVLSESVIRLSQLPAVNAKLRKNTLLKLDKGVVDISVIPRINKKAPFEVTTPMAAAAVRGTRFGVSVSEQDQTSSDVTHGVVAFSTLTVTKNAKTRSAALHAGEGAAVSADGRLGQVHPLLAAPDVSILPEVISDEGFIHFDVPPLSGASIYRARIAKDSALEQVVQNAEFTTSDIRFSALADGDYTLGLRGVDGEGILGYEATRHFKVKATPAYPFYIKPSLGEVVASDVKFNCTNVAGASSYHLQVATDMAFSTLELDAPNLESCAYDASALKLGEYFWRISSTVVNSDKQTEEGPFSSPSSFVVSDSNLTQLPTTIYWIAEPELSYTLQISKDAQFAEMLDQELLSKPEFGIENLPGGSYFVRLQPKSKEGLTGPVSTVRTFNIKLPEQPATERTWMDKAK